MRFEDSRIAGANVTRVMEANLSFRMRLGTFCDASHRLCRLWPISKAGSMTDGDCRELRRGSQGARAHGARVDFLAMPLDGQAGPLPFAFPLVGADSIGK